MKADLEDLSREEFCARFKAEMMKALSYFDGTEAELAEYAEQAAPTYYDEPDQREEGPEQCAREHISYWEG